MTLLKPGEDWYINYINLDSNTAYMNENRQHVFSEMLLANVLIPLLRPVFRYDPYSKTWFEFQNIKWTESNSLYSLLVQTVLEIKIRCQGTGSQQYIVGLNRSQNSQFYSRTLDVLQRSVAMHAYGDDFDNDDRIINTPNGVVDLNSRKVFPNKSEYMCRYLTAVGPLDDQNGAMCPNYINHLKFMSDDDQEMFAALEALSGYILTGETFMQQLYWFYGLQNNGKSALNGIWQYILNDYAITAAQGQFSKTFGGAAHPEQDYRLKNKRAVFVEELTNWNTDKIKSFLSSNPIQAREMFGKSVNFVFKGKIIVTSNHKPPTDGADGGMGRRLNLLPFTRQITDDMRIKDFEKVVLRKEAPYILNRMIKNAQIILSTQDVKMASKTVQATKIYMEANDIGGQFVTDCCETDKYYFESVKDLYGALTQWCADNSYELPTMRKFGQILEGLEYTADKQFNMRGRKGLKLNAAWKKKVGFAPNSLYN